MDPADSRSFRHKLIKILTKSSHISAPFITTFLLIHLSAPVMANAGGSSLSSQVMLLGREYYQTALGEPYLVLGPLAVHALSGIVRRALIIYPKLKKSLPSPAGKTGHSISPLSNFFRRLRAGLPSSTLQLTAYSVLLLLPIHFGIHRLAPTESSPPVLSLGPSELDYSFVQYGLQIWPIRTWTMYTALVGATILHAVEGARVLVGSTTPTPSSLESQSAEKPSNDPKTPMSPRLRRKVLAAALALPVLSGLYFLYTEPLYIFPDMAKRLAGMYRSSWIYSTH
ncbi:hypothetical protein D9757_010967 [Collybiopsis confluens]|uniref:Mitochondrial adapter protein MCP1 transmembrane domain-containing protein n=1 Tax=Collybiopsis confluens TaxID=2823264 RepID=A0A8H5GMX8_9AGAR|nr:hypothetical protein D9757_010967 [Collybiopsis confluens]